MTTVEQAEKIVLEQIPDLGTENLPFQNALGRILAEDILADRDLPPFNRVTMDGIAINYKAFSEGTSTFRIKATQAAGQAPNEIEDSDECIEIMTGAVLPASVDTVIRYEDVEIRNGLAAVLTQEVKQGQNIHSQGKDKLIGDVVATEGQKITPAIINVTASVGKTELLVKRLPRVVIISSGDELVDVEEVPELYQIRRSNNYTIHAALIAQGINAEMLHIPDDLTVTRQQIQICLQQYDAILLSGGISMGKFDYIPQALEELQVNKLFYKVQQRPGKPFWFGRHAGSGPVIFAFPGNPVATFMCLHRYFLPWLQAVQGLSPRLPVFYAALTKEITFVPELKYFLQVKLESGSDAKLLATPVEGNGSGDFANLADTDAFMELPADRTDFKAGDIYRVWRFSN